MGKVLFRLSKLLLIYNLNSYLDLIESAVKQLAEVIKCNTMKLYYSSNNLLPQIKRCDIL